MKYLIRLTVYVAVITQKIDRPVLLPVTTIKLLYTVTIQNIEVNRYKSETLDISF